MFSAVDCLFLPNNADLCLVVLRCEPNSANILNIFFTNEIIFAPITCPLHDPFYGRARGSPGTGEFERNRGDVRWATPGGRPLHPAKAQRGGFEEIPADVSGDARFQPSL